MSAKYRVGPCHAHSSCEVCHAPICTDCDIPESHDHQEAAA